MRYRKTKSSPGQPPSARQGESGSLLRKFLFFSWDEQTKGVVIGPVKLGRESDVPRLHEFGGTLRGLRRKVKSVGDTGPIRIVDEGSFEFGPSTRFAKGDPRQRQIVYVKLDTAAQAAKSTAIENELYGHLDRRYPPRPYMRPALEQSQGKIAEFWADSLGVKRRGIA
jgi:hypothetical protein